MRKATIWDLFYRTSVQKMDNICKIFLHLALRQS